MPVEKGVGGALRPISIDESTRVVSTTEVLRHFRSQVYVGFPATISPLASLEIFRMVEFFFNRSG